MVWRRMKRYSVLMLLLITASNFDISSAFIPSLQQHCKSPIASVGSQHCMFPDSCELLSHDLLAQTTHFPDHILSTFPSITLSEDNAILEAIRTEERPFQYLFMLPTMTMVAICCQLAGIGGAALLSPIFLLIFPLLGPSYPLPTAAAAIASALLTEVFGFASGLSGYARRGLVDWRVALQFMTISVPSSLAGAVVASSVASNPTLLRGIYSVLMLGLSLYLVFSERPETILEEECDVPDDDDTDLMQTVALDGTSYTYLPPKQGDWKSTGATSAGSGLTGLLGVGVGEVILPQLVRGCCMPLPVAAGTSVAVVVMTALTAAVVQFLSLASEVSSEQGLIQGLVQVVPWSLVQFTIPGAILGGQVAPYLASQRFFSDEAIEQFAAVLFGIVGVAFGIKFVVG